MDEHLYSNPSQMNGLNADEEDGGLLPQESYPFFHLRESCPSAVEKIFLDSIHP
jgi:hypothetical protein